jgi:hypothetical protein
MMLARYFTSLASLAAIASASRLFYNSGTTSGWAGPCRHEHDGTVEQVTNVVYDNTASALKMTQRFDANYKGRYHSECDVTDGYQRGDERTYGFAFRLAEGWEFTSQGYNIAQFIANRVGAGCGDDDWMPSTMVWIQGNQLHSRWVYGSYRQPDCGRDIKDTGALATISPGVWHRLVLHVKWRSDSSGFLRIYLDGKEVFNRNVPTTVNDDELFQFRVGLYANSWFDDDHHMVGNQPFRQVWYDEIAIGTTIADVDPGV